MKTFLKSLLAVYLVVMAGVGLWAIDTYVHGMPRAILFYGFWFVVVPTFAAFVIYVVAEMQREHDRARQEWLKKNGFNPDGSIRGFGD